LFRLFALVARDFFNAEDAEVRKGRKFQGNVSQQIPRFPSFRKFRVEKQNEDVKILSTDGADVCRFDLRKPHFHLIDKKMQFSEKLILDISYMVYYSLIQQIRVGHELKNLKSSLIFSPDR